jgi:hypothetical protein
MVAPEYSKKRSQMAHAIGLGRKSKDSAGEAAPARGRPKGAKRAAPANGRRRKAPAGE